MRIIVVSDSHGDCFDLYRAIDAEKHADYVFFLGDGCDEILDASTIYSSRKQFCMVKGNCDLGSKLPANALVSVAGKKIYVTHGYLEDVKNGISGLRRHAEETGADIVLFGHTHLQTLEEENGVYYFNPGSIRACRYGVIDITESGTVCEHKRLMG